MDIYVRTGLNGKRRITIDCQTTINHIGEVVGPGGIAKNHLVFQKMSILTPGIKMNKLFRSVITDADAVLQLKGYWPGYGTNKNGHENDEAVICRYADIGQFRPRTPINIDDKR